MKSELSVYDFITYDDFENTRVLKVVKISSQWNIVTSGRALA